MSNYVLQTNNLVKTYGNQTVINNVNMKIEKGDIYGLIGKNGAGKTTIIRMITGLTTVTNGTLQLFDSEDLNASRKRLGGIVEAPALFLNLSAPQNMEYYRMQRGIVDKEINKKLLALVDLADTGKKKVKDFSLGMKQRLAVALAILGNPDFVILDEPTNGLDPIGIIEMRSTIKRLNEELGITFLISSHILPELSMLATKYGIIEEGHLVKQLTKKELDEECRRCLILHTDSSSKTAMVLEHHLKTNNFLVINEKEIKLYDFLDTPSLVSKTLVEQGVLLNSFVEKGADLEEYFMNTVQEVHKND